MERPEQRAMEARLDDGGGGGGSHLTRRSAAFGFTSAAAGLAATIAANVMLPLGPARAAEPAEKKVVAVPYTPYQVPPRPETLNP
jgi:hypothetical protein